MSLSEDQAKPNVSAFTDAVLGLWAETGRHTSFQVAGNSMLPLIRDGDQVTVAHGPAGIRRGSIVLFRRPDGLVAHRVLRWQDVPSGRLLLTRGDNSPHMDPLLPAAGVVGRVLAVHRAGRIMSLDTPVWRASGWLIATGTLASTALYNRTSRLKQRLLGARPSRFTAALRRGGAVAFSSSLRLLGRIAGRWVDHAPSDDAR